MRIKLAHWYGDHAPGDEIDVDEVTVKALQRDGRVAEVLAYGQGGVLEATPSETVNASDAPEPVEPAPDSGRRKR